MKPASPLKIAVFLDTRPGHRKQTLGLLDALSELTGTETVEIPVPHLPQMRNPRRIRWMPWLKE